MNIYIRNTDTGGDLFTHKFNHGTEELSEFINSNQYFKVDELIPFDKISSKTIAYLAKEGLLEYKLEGVIIRERPYNSFSNDICDENRDLLGVWGENIYIFRMQYYKGATLYLASMPSGVQNIRKPDMWKRVYPKLEIPYKEK